MVYSVITITYYVTLYYSVLQTVGCSPLGNRMNITVEGNDEIFAYSFYFIYFQIPFVKIPKLGGHNNFTFN